ncbi:class E sortase [Streptomyces sp. NBRC 109706]|uniref:class E sortase n=1 Tax=Streptomyces sp. NBRC 109706 TaxID=1550035 RepID=UPI00082E004F|nr:class E sortase [Streptomyces sp. NBRC 109706]
MTASRPGEGAAWDPDQDPYPNHAPYPERAARHGGLDSAVDALHDPLRDPLPGQRGAPAAGGTEDYAGLPAADFDGYGDASGALGGYQEQPSAHDPETVGLDVRAARRKHDPETVGLRRPDDLKRAGERAGARAEEREPAAEDAPPTGGRAARRRAAQRAEGREAAPAPGGRAARRRAAKGGGRRASSAAVAAEPAEEPEVSGGRAARRKAAKAAAKAARQTGTAISNVIGELFITTGVVLLLFVVYQLWWTNVEARAHANGKANELQERWEDPDGTGGGEEEENRDPGVFSAGEGFAILYLPTLDVRVPVAESVDPGSVLDNGMVGHYTEGDGLPTAMPWDEEGNFGLAGHRNTHGEPFRYINNLEPGDPIVIETESAYYTYEMRTRLDSTSPSNIEVLDPIPEQGGFTEPGRYITLTTCTPEFTSTYRLIVWGELAEERPRAEGKPDALVN